MKDGEKTDAAPVAAAVQTAAAEETWYSRFLNWFRRAARRLFRIVIPSVAAGILEFLNDERNQRFALDAVRAAIDAGLRGNDAWDLARGELLERLEAAGRRAAATLVDTLLQNAYCAVKYSVAGEGAACSD